MPGPYQLGCPIWACEHWRGGLYGRKASREQWLGQYADVFDAVEGNGTFYGLPRPDTVRRWADSVPSGFAFCLKVPRVITHDGRLRGHAAQKRAFLDLLAILADAGVLGPTLMQLGPGFDRTDFDALQQSLRRWPNDFPLAVEVRHRDWYDEGPVEASLDDLLRESDHDRVLFDSRALYATPPQTPCETVSQTRKPRTPIRRTVTGRRPMVRFIGRDDVAAVDPWIDEWVRVVAGWIDAGLRPIVFTHSPDDRFAPDFARRFHRRLVEVRANTPPLPKFRGESEPKAARQPKLF